MSGKLGECSEELAIRAANGDWNAASRWLARSHTSPEGARGRCGDGCLDREEHDKRGVWVMKLPEDGCHHRSESVATAGFANKRDTSGSNEARASKEEWCLAMATIDPAFFLRTRP